MEILYVWINKDDKGLLCETGINFSPEFQFELSKNDEEYRLSENPEWVGKKSIFDDSNVLNVTAIVGKNGTGKTTILNALAALDCVKINARKPEPSYEKFYADKSEKKKTLLIVRNDQQEVIIYHNLPVLINNTMFQVIDVNEGDIYRDFLINNEAYHNITQIYVTNSNYGGISGISSHRKLSSIALSPNNISTISKTYYKQLLDLDKPEPSANVWTIYCKLIRAKKSVEEFQSLYLWADSVTICMS